MNLHEYQSKQLLEKFGLPTAKSVVAFSSEEVVGLIAKLKGHEFVAKVQVHAEKKLVESFRECRIVVGPWPSEICAPSLLET